MKHLQSDNSSGKHLCRQFHSNDQPRKVSIMRHGDSPRERSRKEKDTIILAELTTPVATKTRCDGGLRLKLTVVGHGRSTRQIVHFTRRADGVEDTIEALVQILPHKHASIHRACHPARIDRDFASSFYFDGKASSAPVF